MKRALGLLVAAGTGCLLGLAGGGVLMAGALDAPAVQERLQEAKRPEDTVMVIVAAGDLAAGATIREEDLYAVQVPPRFLPDGVFFSPEHVVGARARTPILANTFLRRERLTDVPAPTR